MTVKLAYDNPLPDTICVKVYPGNLTLEERNRRAMQMYWWLEEQVGRFAWHLNSCDDYIEYWVPEAVVLIFKLRWGGR